MNETTLTNNRVLKYLEKNPEDITREDLVDFVVNNGVEMINFMYPAADGRLKTLNFVINDLDYLNTILTSGERVDGSSLFPGFIEAGNSDLYVIPRYSTAFLDPFAEIPTLSMLCNFFDKDGNELASSPERALRRACAEFRKATGLEFQAMGELEYYVISPDEGMFPASDQRGYHESAPFAKFNDFRTRCMQYIARTGGKIKYGHSEVGNFTLNGMNYEQNEIEFLPVPAEQAADQLMLAKWVIRNLASRLNLNVTFAPKITNGKAGSGLHVHMRLMRDGRNVMLDADRRLSDDARRLIAGLITLAPALTAFGNTNPTSYFRLVPHQEAPTNVCWGDRNRSVLIRVPLGWTTSTDMSAVVNPAQKPAPTDASQKQTIEIRNADGSADIYMLLAGLAVAARHGFDMADALDVAERTYVSANIHDEANAALLERLEQLPANCVESADVLEQQRELFEASGVFTPAMIDAIVARLRAFDDASLSERAHRDPDLMGRLVSRYFHCG